MNRNHIIRRAWRHRRFKFIFGIILFLVTANHLSGGNVESHSRTSSDSKIFPHFGQKFHSQLVCPSESVKARNGDDMEDYKALELENANDFDLEKLKLSLNDGWSRDFYQRKKDYFNWKKDHFGSLKAGDKIYESACGRGLNLLMTLEILMETHGVGNIIVYGNDYLEHSVRVANQILSKSLENGNQLGSICQGDSSNLPHVPSDFFDLVFTGRKE